MQRIIVVGSIALMIGLGGYLVASRPTLIKIREIVDHPREFDGNQVSVSGRVTDVFSVLGVGYFKISDGTGTIAILSTKANPKMGQTAVIRGVVRPALAIGDDQLLVIVEAADSPPS